MYWTKKWILRLSIFCIARLRSLQGELIYLHKTQARFHNLHRCSRLEDNNDDNDDQWWFDSLKERTAKSETFKVNNIFFLREYSLKVIFFDLFVFATLLKSANTCLQCHSGFKLTSEFTCVRSSINVVNEFHSFYSQDGRLQSRHYSYIVLNEKGVFLRINNCLE